MSRGQLAHRLHSAGIALVKITALLSTLRWRTFQILPTVAEMPTDPAVNPAAADLIGRHHKGAT